MKSRTRHPRRKTRHASKRTHKLSGYHLLTVIVVVVVAIATAFYLTFPFRNKRTNVLAASSFQPSAPYYATFFYGWYKNPQTDGTWSDWQDLGHTPPQNWFSNYLPDPNPALVDPVNELYSSNNDNTIYWQLSKLAEAKQEVAIASWWGQNHKTDTNFSHIIKDVMNRPDNPYPNLRWALYHECEGNSCNGTSNPSVSQLVTELNYIAANYAVEPGYLRINDKPVIFVYADGTDGGSANTNCADASDTSMTHRWSLANSQATTHFYIVLKVFGGYATDPCQPDSWHQYAPAVRYDSQGNNSFMVSPGFWLDGSQIRLPRDLTAFRDAVSRMTASSATWRLTETWNEIGEGTGIEPAEEVIQTASGTAILNTNGTPFKNQYVDVLSQLLPPLEQGVGMPSATPVVSATSTPQPTSTPVPTSAVTPTPTPTYTPTPQPTSTPSAPAVVSLFATADTYVDSSNKTKNYGSTLTMYADSSPTKISYLKFNLSSLAGKTITNAKLHIRVSSDNSVASQLLKAVADTAWNETTVTYNNRPTLGGTIFATINSSNKTNVWVDIDVTQAVVGHAGQLISLGVDSASSDGINFTTRESANVPALIVTVN